VRGIAKELGRSELRFGFQITTPPISTSFGSRELASAFSSFFRYRARCKSFLSRHLQNFQLPESFVSLVADSLDDSFVFSLLLEDCSQSRRFFQVWLPFGLPRLADHPVYFGSAISFAVRVRSRRVYDSTLAAAGFLLPFSKKGYVPGQAIKSRTVSRQSEYPP